MTPFKQISDIIPQLFPLEERENCITVHTPFLYPDGDCIVVYVESKPNETFIISDFGETMRWLRGNTQAIKRTPKQTLIIQDICLTHDVTFTNGSLQVVVPQMVEVPEAIFRVAQAAIRVSDIWLTFRNRTVQSAAEEVSEYLNEKAVIHERNRKEAGRSGRNWNVDFYSKTEQRNSFISFLSTGSRYSAKSSVEHVLACYYDIRPIYANDPHYSYISLIDDTNDVWEAADFNLLSQISDVVFWSEPTQMLATIGVQCS